MNIFNVQNNNCSAFGTMPHWTQGQPLLCNHRMPKVSPGTAQLWYPSLGPCRFPFRGAAFLNYFYSWNRCKLLQAPEWAWSPGLELGCDRFILGVTSGAMSQLPPITLGAEDEKCPLSRVKIKRKQSCSCRLHFSLLLAMWQTACVSPFVPGTLQFLLIVSKPYFYSFFWHLHTVTWFDK